MDRVKAYKITEEMFETILDHLKIHGTFKGLVEKCLPPECEGRRCWIHEGHFLVEAEAPLSLDGKRVKAMRLLGRSERPSEEAKWPRQGDIECLEFEDGTLLYAANDLHASEPAHLLVIDPKGKPRLPLYEQGEIPAFA